MLAGCGPSGAPDEERSAASRPAAGSGSAAGSALVSDLDRRESVLLLPTVGRLLPSKNAWQIEIAGWVFELGDSEAVRTAMSRLVTAGLSLTDNESRALVRRRLRMFAVDNERDKTVVVVVAGKRYAMPQTDSDGRFHGTIAIPTSVAPIPADANSRVAQWLDLRVALPFPDKRSFRGRVRLVGDEGVTVISDIDDTVKISQVRDKRALLANTFARPYQAVPGMAQSYRQWEAEGAAFHYVSNSPIPLYPPLAQFFERVGLPAGTFAFRPFRWKDGSFLEMLDTDGHKLTSLRKVIKASPQRRFILVGDTGERDPEIYGDIAREFPRQITGIFLRIPDGEEVDDPRLEQAFRALPRDRWAVFRRGADLPASTHGVSVPVARHATPGQ